MITVDVGFLEGLIGMLPEFVAFGVASALALMFVRNLT